MEYDFYIAKKPVKLKSGYKVYFEKNKAKFCSQVCYHLNVRGKPLTGERLKQQRKLALIAVEARKNNPEIREKWILKMKEVTLGSKNHAWIEDRSKLVNQDERNSYQYQMWRKEVWLRDNWKCKIANPDCDGRIEVHHILSWKDYPELHYKINNGITLCHAHHPRKRSEEKRLIPIFQELVSVSK